MGVGSIGSAYMEYKKEKLLTLSERNTKKEEVVAFIVTCEREKWL
jgi:hypothetical protein